MERARQVGAKSVPQPKPLERGFLREQEGQRNSDRVLKKQMNQKKSHGAIGR